MSVDRTQDYSSFPKFKNKNNFIKLLLLKKTKTVLCLINVAFMVMEHFCKFDLLILLFTYLSFCH